MFRILEIAFPDSVACFLPVILFFADLFIFDKKKLTFSPFPLAMDASQGPQDAHKLIIFSVFKMFFFMEFHDFH